MTGDGAREDCVDFARFASLSFEIPAHDRALLIACVFLLDIYPLHSSHSPQVDPVTFLLF